MTDDPNQLDTDIQGAEVEAADTEERRNLYREAAINFMDFSDRRDMFIIGYNGKERDLAYECTLLAIGKAELLGKPESPFTEWNAASLAKRHNVKKASVSKIVKKFQSSIYIEPLQGQRSLEACRKFAAVRRNQIKPPQ